MQYAGKTAVITGAASGIGRALAINVAGRGAALAISDVNETGLAETAKTCEAAGAKVRHYRVDVADRQAVLDHADAVIADFGRADLVVNNAGVALMATVEEMKWEDLDWLIGINFWGVVHGTKAFLPHLIASGDGHLVNLSSVFGFIGVPTQSAYNAAKFAVRGFTEALRQEMLIAGHPVGVHCVHPGGIDTNIARSARIADPTVDREESAKRFSRVARTTPDRAAKVILDGVDRNRGRILIGADSRVLDAIPRLFGPHYQGAASWLTRRFGPQAGLQLPES
ncbi:MAG TPA: SDR family NAD(P)-dependent oxidoreductase [Mycobacteriales bacterium]|nr:SDR family NAD(P)-dependent oxidoreductase [Mycobacteriales bacterium]